jgi:hypothetical protein
LDGTNIQVQNGHQSTVLSERAGHCNAQPARAWAAPVMIAVRFSRAGSRKIES